VTKWLEIENKGKIYDNIKIENNSVE